jgi:ribose transport system substrate-binding protein
MHRRFSRLAAVFVVLTLAAVGCSKAASPPAPAASAEQASGSGTADLGYVKAQIEKYMKIPTFTAPGPAFDVSGAKGKKIFNVPLSSTIPFVQTLDEELARLSGKLGVQFIQCPNQGQVAQYVQCVNQAVSQKVDLVHLDQAPNPASLQPQLTQAQNSGIKTVASHIYDVTGDPTPAGHLDATTPAGFTTASRLAADWAIMKTAGKAHVLAVTADDIVPHTQMGEAIKGELNKYCGSGCTYTNLNVPLTEWATKLQTSVQSALLANPDINYVIPVVDGMTSYVVPGVIAASAKGRAHVATFNGTPFAMKYLQDDNVIDMIVGENLNWNAWADMDQMLRVLTGQSPVKDEGTALRIFTADNISEAGTPPKVNVGYGDAYINGYTALWNNASVR